VRSSLLGGHPLAANRPEPRGPGCRAWLSREVAAADPRS
jgi:hypothetical protein